MVLIPSLSLLSTQTLMPMSYVPGGLPAVAELNISDLSNIRLRINPKVLKRVIRNDRGSSRTKPAQLVSCNSTAKKGMMVMVVSCMGRWGLTNIAILDYLLHKSLKCSCTCSLTVNKELGVVAYVGTYSWRLSKNPSCLAPCQKSREQATCVIGSLYCCSGLNHYSQYCLYSRH